MTRATVRSGVIGKRVGDGVGDAVCIVGLELKGSEVVGVGVVCAVLGVGVGVGDGVGGDVIGCGSSPLPFPLSPGGSSSSVGPGVGTIVDGGGAVDSVAGGAQRSAQAGSPGRLSSKNGHSAHPKHLLNPLQYSVVVQ